MVIGTTRAAQDDTSHAGYPTLDPSAALAVLVHGDAAFPGQGVVAETLNMSGLPGYTVGGTLHLIANNQIGFTTNPEDDRSTRYSSDLAKGFEIPVVHVNADDAEACLAVARLAYAYRAEFRQGLRHRPLRLPPLGAQRGRRAALHAAEDVRGDPLAPHRARGAGRAAGGRGRARPGRCRRDAAEGLRSARPRRRPRSRSRHSTAPKPSPNGGPDAIEPKTAVPAETLRELNRGADAAPRRASRPTRAWRRTCSRSGTTRSTRTAAASTGATRRRWPSPRCSPRACRSASPGRTPSAAPSATATPCCTTPRRARS